MCSKSVANNNLLAFQLHVNVYMWQMWLDLTHIWLGFLIMSNVSFVTTYLSKVKCQLYHIYMHVTINLAFIYTYLHKEVNWLFFQWYLSFWVSIYHSYTCYHTYTYFLIRSLHGATHALAVDASSLHVCTDEWHLTASTFCTISLSRKKAQAASRSYTQSNAQMNHPQRIFWLLLAVLNATRIVLQD